MDNLFAIIVAVVVILPLAWLADTGIVYLGVEAIGGHDLSFREAGGLGLILLSASGASAAS